jgi:tetratricopeptide (TPR) repeat protein
MAVPEVPKRLPRALLADPEMISACARHDFAAVFRMVQQHAGIYPSMIARACELTPGRVGDVINRRHRLEKFEIVVRIADGLHIPGRMLGLATRPWESEQEPATDAAVTSRPAVGAVPLGDSALIEPEFFSAHIRSGMPEHYKSMNLFGARHALNTVEHHVRYLDRLQAHTDGSTRDDLLTLGSRAAEFLGWLYQDLGDFEKSGYWSDRAMEWAQETGDDLMTAYVLFRKSNQATARRDAQKAIGLARAAQRVPGVTVGIRALAAQQEAQGHALLGNLRFALGKFDEAHELAESAPGQPQDAALDTTYCTPAYIEIQRANCLIELGDPHQAIDLFEAELRVLPKAYRNDHGVYLSRLARAYATAGEPDQAAHAAGQALAIVRDTESARGMSELTAAGETMRAWQTVSGVSDFHERLSQARGEIGTPHPM